MKKAFASICVIWALVFVYSETIYFGNNFLPMAPEEYICDITALLLFITGVIIFKQDKEFK